MENIENQPAIERIPTLAEDILAEFGHLFVAPKGPLVDTSWAQHIERQRPLTTHFFSAYPEG